MLKFTGLFPDFPLFFTIKLEILTGYDQKNGVIYLSAPNPDFEQLYIAVRDKEQRLYSPEELRQLPKVPAQHRFAGEWEMRQESFSFLQKILTKDSPKQVLEIGCGNGWLSYQLSKSIDCQVYALDINATELEQGAMVLKNDRLTFIYADIFDAGIHEGILPKFDAIIFAASLQYFPDLPALMRRIAGFLQPDGAVHILDSPFYHQANRRDAQERSLQYYRQLGFAEMSAYYFHHTWENIAPFSPQIMYRPSMIRRWFLGRKNPFPYLKINPKNLL